MFEKLMDSMRNRIGRSAYDFLHDPALIDYRRLQVVAERHAESYKSAEPFPHIVIDDFLNRDILRAALKTFPTKDAINWLRRDAKSKDGIDVQRHKLDFSLGRRDLDNEMKLSALVRYLLLEFNSATFLRFLQNLTGIRDLISDPGMFGGGLHQSMPDGILAIHADFTKHPVYQLDRRLNVLLFLNENWREAYGGNLEFWSADMKTKVRDISPIANRCVIFTTLPHSYHGFTRPVACPPEQTRKSVAMYYYTVPAAMHGRVESITDWQTIEK